MSRCWINSPNEELKLIIHKSQELKLYLIQENGPMSFVFKDDNNIKFNVCIGESIKCSCEFKTNIINNNYLSKISLNKNKIIKTKKTGHCPHSIYVLNKLFNIDINNPLIFQNNYNNNEISYFIQNRLSLKKTNYLNSNEKYIEANDNKQSINVFDVNLKELSLTQDVLCAICQEDMYRIQKLHICSFCGRHYHYKCLDIWKTHKLSNFEEVTCPMCRKKLLFNDDKLSGNNICTKKTFKLPNFNNNKSYIHNNKNCNNCVRKNIKYDIFHCIDCIDDINYCLECFVEDIMAKKVKCFEHNFVTKKFKEDKWVGTDLNNSNKKTSSISSKECRFNSYNLKLSQYLISIIKPLNSFNTIDINNEIDIKNTDIKSLNNNFKNTCFVCGTDNQSKIATSQFLLIKKCRHLVHVKCVNKLFDIDYNSNKQLITKIKNFNVCNYCYILNKKSYNSFGSNNFTSKCTLKTASPNINYLIFPGLSYLNIIYIDNIPIKIKDSKNYLEINYTQDNTNKNKNSTQYIVNIEYLPQINKAINNNIDKNIKKYQDNKNFKSTKKYPKYIDIKPTNNFIQVENIKINNNKNKVLKEQNTFSI